VVDGGDWAWKTARINERMLPSQQRKGQLIAESFTLSGIDGMVPGEGDLAMGLPWLKEQVARLELPMLAANLVCAGEAPFVAQRVVEREGVKLGLVGVVGTGIELGPDCSASDPVAATVSAVAVLRDAGVDLVVVLSHQDGGADRSLAEAVPDIDLVVNGHARLTHTSPRQLPGAALELAAGSRGKHLGVASGVLVPGGSGFQGGADGAGTIAQRLDGLRTRRQKQVERIEEGRATFTPAALDSAEKQLARIDEQVKDLEGQLAALTTADLSVHHRLSSKAVDLEEAVADHPATRALLDQANVDIAAMEVAAAEGVNAAAGPYVGSATCQGCHPTQFAQWKSTPHAGAWDTLAARTMDPACYSCHSTGSFHPLGPQSAAEVGVLKNVGCESCHGPGREHAGSTATDHRPGLEVVAQATCVQCHDGVQDEGRFDYATYLPKVVHGPSAPSTESRAGTIPPQAEPTAHDVVRPPQPPRK
jgi:Cytochrome c554 and c-prime